MTGPDELSVFLKNLVVLPKIMVEKTLGKVTVVIQQRRGFFLRIVYDARSVEHIGNMFNVSDIVGIYYEHSDKIYQVLAHLNPKVVCKELGVDEYGNREGDHDSMVSHGDNDSMVGHGVEPEGGGDDDAYDEGTGLTKK